ncbi:MAG TPA: YceI family protein [Rhizomicrobium sp.]|nr:YceI family protein [Rhizomicrobium sp.]
MRAVSIFTVALVLVGPALAADAPPMKLPHGQHDVRTATAGTYTLDPNHTAVIARVSHLGFSMSAFRFGKAQATLEWDPAHIEKSKLSATVDPGSIATPVPDFAQELTGADYLNVAKFPAASFVSTAFRKKDFAHGIVDGKLTLLGKTVNTSFAVTLVGAGPGFAGGPTMGHVIGIHAVTHVSPKAIGLPAVFQEPIEIAIDTEFDKAG